MQCDCSLLQPEPVSYDQATLDSWISGNKIEESPLWLESLLFGRLGREAPFVDSIQVDVKNWRYSRDKPDFALKYSYYGKPAYVIEAKKLSNANPEKHSKQVHKYLRYCPNVILTDGIEWYFFTRKNLDPQNPLWSLDLRIDHRDLVLTLLASLYRGEQHPSEQIKKAIIEAYDIQYRFLEKCGSNVVNKLGVIDVVFNEIASSVRTA